MLGQKGIATIEPYDRFIWNGSADCYYDHVGDVLWINPDASSLPALSAITRHELSHYALFWSTPLGQVCKELQLRDFRNLVTTSHQNDSPFTYPLYYVATRKQVPELLLEGLVKPWSAGFALEAILMGKNSTSVMSAKQLDLLTVISRFEDDISIILKKEDLAGNSAVNAPLKHPPVVRLDEDVQFLSCPSGAVGDLSPNLPIGAEHIFEAFAWLTEIGSPSFGQTANCERKQTYCILFGLICEKFGLNRLDSKDAMETVYATFKALCDLALFIPLGYVYGRLRSTQTTWVDIHPGYRFLTALHAVASENLWLSSGSDVRKFHNLLSTKLGWESPVRFLELGANLCFPEFSRHGEACRLRLKEYDAFFSTDYGSGFKEFFRKFLPIMRLPTRPMASLGSTTHDEGLGKIVDYYIHNVLYQLMLQRGDFEWSKVVPAGINYSKHFSNIRNESEMIQMLWKTFPNFNRTRMLKTTC